MAEGAYGSIIFGRARGRINTFYEIKKRSEGRYGAHMVHLRKPLLEWAGNDLLAIELGFALNAAWCGDPNIILAEWHFYHENAIPAPLIVGGKPLGPGLSLFVVEGLEELHKYWLPGGQLLAVELHTSFKEYIPFAEGLVPQLGVPGFASGALPVPLTIGAGAI
jgi:Phage P2 GpU